MKPILFNTEMVKALLDGRKTVTRRPLKGDAREHIQIDVDNSVIGVYDMFEGTVRPVLDYAPYRPGDILYVRETFGWFSEENKYVYKASDFECVAIDGFKWSPSLHMPKEAARIFLRVTGVRVERLQDIECIATEGIAMVPADDKRDPRYYFAKLWDSTVKKSDLPLYGWDASPWVWVIEFERISKEDAYNA